jgi:ABC-type transport system involved in cytochrome bd biosynthesis fused ATPase/permease subunit
MPYRSLRAIALRTNKPGAPAILIRDVADLDELRLRVVFPDELYEIRVHILLMIALVFFQQFADILLVERAAEEIELFLIVVDLIVKEMWCVHDMTSMVLFPWFIGE